MDQYVQLHPNVFKFIHEDHHYVIAKHLFLLLRLISIHQLTHQLFDSDFLTQFNFPLF